MFIKLRDKKAFTLVEIMIVVAIIGLLIAIALPNFIKAREQARKNLCLNAQRLLTHGAEQAKIELNLADDAFATEAQALEYVKGGAVECPGGGTISLGADGVATCTIATHVPVE